jgi:hypothetical protein
LLGSTNLPRLPLGILWGLLPEADQFLLPNAQLLRPLNVRTDVTSDSSVFLVAVVGPIPASLRQSQSFDVEPE